jgi:hypothetical protein
MHDIIRVIRSRHSTRGAFDLTRPIAEVERYIACPGANEDCICLQHRVRRRSVSFLHARETRRERLRPLQHLRLHSTHEIAEDRA